MPGDNTLRPYYDHDTFNAGYLVIFKPGVGLIDTNTRKPVVASLGHSMNQSSFASGKGLGLSGMPQSGNTTITSGDKNYVYDLEFQEYFDFNNALELLKNLMWNFFKNYCKVLLSQPLEIVRLVLQVGYFDFSLQKKETKKYSRLLDTETSSATDASESEADYDEIDYFQLPRNSGVLPKRSKKKVAKSKVPKNTHKIHPLSPHTIDIMTAIASKDGPFALFRGINASFIHFTLSHTIEAWITGFISPFLGIPDPFFLDLTHLTEPIKSLWLSVLACVLAGVVLMPLDLIKVRMMLTQFNKPLPDSEPASVASSPSQSQISNVSTERTANTRSVRDSIRNFPVPVLLYPPPTITLLTVLHQVSTTVFRKSAPYLLFIRYNIDSYLSPNLYTMVNLVLLITELFIKLPVENLLRKEQVRFLLKPKSLEEDRHRIVTIDNPEENLIVTFNGWDPAHEKQEDGTSTGLWTRFTMLGLFNGWRVGVLNVIGFWGYNIFKGSTVMTEERL